MSAKSIRKYLEGLDRGELVELLVKQASENKTFRQSLTMQLAMEAKAGPDFKVIRSAVETAFGQRGFIDYQAMPSFAKRCREISARLRELTESGHAAETISLVEIAICRCEQTADQCDDSAGHMRTIFDDLQEVHLAACLAAHLDPETLARRLFEWELKSEWEVFYGSAETYSEVLGEPGLAVFRDLAAQEWAKYPTLKPGDSGRHDGKRFQITAMMTSLARLSGNVEEIAAVLASDLSTPYCFFRVAEAYREAGDQQSRIDWLERGMVAFPDHRDQRLVDALSTEYHSLGWHDEALQLVWQHFSRFPTFEAYAWLCDHAERADQSLEWRSRAQTLLRQHCARQIESRRDFGAGGSELVRVFIWEHDVEAAWAVIIEFGSSAVLALQVAELREGSYPEDSLRIYQKLIEPAIRKASNPGYEEAVDLLIKVRRALSRMGREAEFAAIVQSIQATHKAKRNLMALIAAQQWAD